MFKVNKKDTSKTKFDCCSTLVRFEQTLHGAWVLLWPFFEKQVNVQCGIGSIAMLISSHIHNAANRAIANNSWQSYFKKFEVLFSRKQQGTIRTDLKIYSCIFYHLCIMVTVFQVATSLSIFSTTISSLAQYRTHAKSNYIFKYANWNINLIIVFRNTHYSLLAISCVLYFSNLYNSFALIWNKNPFMFPLVFFLFSYFSQHLPQISSKVSD